MHVPGLHDRQTDDDVAAATVLYFPAAHFTHTEATAPLYLPKGQVEHTPDPGGAAVPAAQSVQLAIDIAPMESPRVPMLI